ncbi:uncharacterized protein LOC143862688 [Tasmannia lanceolata]|uniref:uncharacterized protein LOC143862688 n=1 Tax=Tasmannia lanceolata TaxID=3420 RepID=UPI0040635477
MRKRNLTIRPSHSLAQDSHDDSQARQQIDQTEDLDDQAEHEHTQPQSQHRDPQDSSVPQTPAVASSSKRKCGPIYCKDTWGLFRSQRKRVQFNKLSQPVGKRGKKFTNFLGTVARLGSRLPIDQFDWRQVPNEQKEDAWECVQDHYDVDVIHKSWILSNIGSKWKDWKCYLKRAYFDPGLPCTDDRVMESQWRALCIHCPHRLVSETNKSNRSNQLMMHTAGTKSFACICYDKEKDGQVISRPEMFKLSSPLMMHQRI